jgi:selenocysteine lyase/cysteine desulfurase
METNNIKDSVDVMTVLKKSIEATLETYSNVHRGSGHFSQVTSELFEQARKIILKYLNLLPARYTVIFCTSWRSNLLCSQLKPGQYQLLSSSDIGLSLGVTALAVKKRAIKKCMPTETGGGNARLISRRWVVWTKAPGRFEAGTPAITNIIAFARALRISQQYGTEVFKNGVCEKLDVRELLYKDELFQYNGSKLLDKLKDLHIGKWIEVPTTKGKRFFTNLDNAASTPTFRPIWESFWESLQLPVPAKKELIKEVKNISSEFLGAPPDEYDILFTSNTTEGINIVAKSFVNQYRDDVVIINTMLEHNSNELPWRMASAISTVKLQINENGIIDLQELESLLKSIKLINKKGHKRIILVTVSGASNVLGIVNDLNSVSQLVHRYGAYLLVDAAQLAGHRKISVKDDNIDYLVLSGHKMYAPFGSGILVVKKGLPGLHADELEKIRLSGEENAGGIAALGKSMCLLQQIGFDTIIKEERQLTEHLLNRMNRLPGIKIHGISEPDSPFFNMKSGVVVFNHKTILSERIARKLAEQGGIGIRYGCHCSHILIKHILGVKPFLENFQRIIVTLFPNLELPGVARVSLGICNSYYEVDRFADLLSSILEVHHSRGRGWTSMHTNKTGDIAVADIRKQIDEFIQRRTELVYRGV